MDSDKNVSQQRRLILVTVVLAAVAAVAAILVRRWRAGRAAETVESVGLALPPLPADVTGLTEAEAAARQLEGQDNAVQFHPPRERNQIIRDNVYTIFNLSLVGLVTVQLLLGQALAALTSLGVMSLNIGVNIAQELLSKRRLEQFAQSTQPQATVMREGEARSIDPGQIVLGDILIVGPGDQLFVDGQVVGYGQIEVNESMVTGQRGRLTKRAGDQAYAGSFCVSGRAALETEKVGGDRLISTLVGETQAAKEELTPLERIIEGVLRLLLVVVGLFTLILLLKYFRIDTGIPGQVFSDAASVIFNIAPAGLFFMIVVSYAAGTRDLARIGALVHRSRSVESLAQATVMCFAQAGILTGLHVEVEPIEAPEDGQRPDESRIRHILGDYARSTSLDNLATRATVATFEGERRTVYAEAPFMSLYGWSGLAFDDEDLRGVYVLGDPQVLEAHVVADGKEPAKEEGEGRGPAVLRKAFSPIGRFFRRSDETPPENGSEPAEEPEKRPAFALDRPESQAPEEEGETKPGLFRRLAKRVNRVISREETAPEEDVAEDEAAQESVLLFAYRPELLPFYDGDGAPQLPEGLIPLCRLRYTERVRPEAIETIKGFSATGVGTKVFTSGAPEKTAAILKQAGLGSSDHPLTSITGFELADMNAEQLAEAVQESSIFSYLTPEQAGQVVGALRQGGQSVALVANGVNDVPAMQQANLSIAMHSSSPAALSVADILLLEDSPEVLLRVLEKGQRIVNGLLDVLKLYLTQVLYLALLYLAIVVFSYGYPYQGKQGGLISLLTLTVPSLALSLFAVSGVLPTAHLSRLLRRFVVPAAVTLSAAALVVYLIFLDRTGDLRYAQLAVTYTLVGAGLLLLVFVRPPRRFWLVGGPPSRDWLFTGLAVVLLVIFILMTFIPLAYELFAVERLRQPSDYLVVGIAILAWAIAVRILWRIIPLDPEASSRLGDTIIDRI